MLTENSSVYFDVSKFYARGLHLGFNSLLKNYSVVLLARDPFNEYEKLLK